MAVLPEQKSSTVLSIEVSSGDDSTYLSVSRILLRACAFSGESRHTRLYLSHNFPPHDQSRTRISGANASSWSPAMDVPYKVGEDGLQLRVKKEAIPLNSVQVRGGDSSIPNCSLKDFLIPWFSKRSLR